MAVLVGLAGLLCLVAGLTMAGSEHETSALDCDPHYPDFCIPPYPPDLDCTQLTADQRNFRAYAPDPHGFDIDSDGIGCEDPMKPNYPRRTLPVRAFAIMAACDSCVTAGPSTPVATATPTNTQVGASPTATKTNTPPGPTNTPTATASPSNTPTKTPTQAVCGGGTAQITGLNKSGNPETVAITGNGLMTGWYVISESGNQRFDFPTNYILSSSVVLESGPAATNAPPSRLLWTNQNIWNNNSDDDAFLYDCTGALRSSFEDGQ